MAGRDWTRRQFVVRFVIAIAVLVICMYVLALVATRASGQA